MCPQPSCLLPVAGYGRVEKTPIRGSWSYSLPAMPSSAEGLQGSTGLMGEQRAGGRVYSHLNAQWPHCSPLILPISRGQT